MKKEAAVIRHPHYPEIIKFKVGSLKTISTLSNSNCDNEDLNNCLSLPNECFTFQDSCIGDCSCHKKRSNLNGGFEQSYFDMEEPNPPYDDEIMLPDSNPKDMSFGEHEQMQSVFKSPTHY